MHLGEDAAGHAETVVAVVVVGRSAVVGRPGVVGPMVMVVGPVVVVRAIVVVGLHIAVPRVPRLQHGHRCPLRVCSPFSGS